MDREIKFRGKSAFDNQWYYGGYHKGKRGDTCIVDSGACFIIVNPETVGEFTGAYDCDGKEIFENDIIEKNEAEGIYKRGKVAKRNGGWSIVYFDNGFDDIFWLTSKTPLKVIGNIHDNKELLERKE